MIIGIDDTVSFRRSKTLVPTRVGMILNKRLYQSANASCPHTRGDDPYNHPQTLKIALLSPHAWG